MPMTGRDSSTPPRWRPRERVPDNRRDTAQSCACSADETRTIARCRVDCPELARVGATEAACWNPVPSPA